MKKVLKFVNVIVLCFSFLCLNIVDVYADGLDDLGKVVDGSKLIDEQYSESIAQSLIRGNILNQGTTRITNNGDGTANIYGAVLGSVTCDKLRLKLTIQQYRNGSWYNYGTYSDVAYNTSTFSRSWDVSVSGGYYYRVKAACVAQKGSTTESQLPITDGLWIG